MPEQCLNDEQANALVRGDLLRAEAVGFEAHIDGCSSCQQVVALLAQVITHASDQASDHGSDTQQELQPGDHIGRYSVLSPAGSGAMSVVYEAYDPNLDRSIAIKLLRTDTVGSAASTRVARLLLEARTLARLSHENVVVVHEVGTHGHQVFIAMEFVRGHTLTQWLAGTPRSQHEIIDVFLAVGRGLCAAHDAGLVHRDVKPDNVLVGADGRVRVTDFGLAMVDPDPVNPPSESTSIRITRTGMCVGTPAYMAPEQWDGEGSALSDQFSFCVALFEACSGHRPFAGETIVQLLLNVNAGKVEGSVSQAWLQRVLARGLAVDPSKRFPSMKALLTALEKGNARRSKKLVASLALGAGTVAVLGVLALRPDSSTRCGDLGQPLRRLWSESRKVAMRETILHTGDSYAPAAAQNIEQRLSSYVIDWSAATSSVCEQSERNEVGPQIRKRMDQCLDDGLQRFDELITILTESKTIAVAKSVKAVAGLDAPEYCAEADRVRHRRLQDANAAEDRQRVVQGQMLFDTGQYKESVQLLEVLDDDAADRESSARAALVSCAAWGRLGDGKKSVDACHAAALIASAAGHADITARAWALLVTLVGSQGAKYQEAELWARYAKAALLRAGGSKKISGLLSNGLGIVEKQQGHHPEAKAHYHDALQLYEQAYGERNLRVARILNNLAILEGVMGESEKAQEHHLRSLSIKQETLGEMHPDLAVSLLNIGLLYQYSDEEKARSYYKRALEVSEHSLSAEHMYVAVILTNMAKLDRRNGNYDDAQKRLERALPIFENAYGKRHPRVAAAVEGLALVAEKRHATAKALQLHDRVLEMRLAIYPEGHEDIANSLNFIGLLLLDSKKNAEALNHFERALIVRRKALGEEHFDVAWDLFGVGAAQRALGRNAVALATQEKARDLAEHALQADELRASIAAELAQLAHHAQK